jgi:excisionase family DNA binding protein
MNQGKPLFTLSIEEYIALTKGLVEEILRQQQAPQASQTDPEPCLDIAGLARFLKCSKVSIHNYKKLGMPFYRVGRKLLFKKEEVLNFMKQLRFKKTKKPS